MRQRKIKQILDFVVNEKNELMINEEGLYQNQAFKISKSKKFISALRVLSNFVWLDFSYEEFKKEVDIENTELFTASEMQKIRTVVSKINAQLPYYLSFLDTIIDDQSEQDINIKTPLKNIKNINEVSGFVTKLDKSLTPRELPVRKCGDESYFPFLLFPALLEK